MKMRQHRKRQAKVSQQAETARFITRPAIGPGSHRKQVALFAARIQLAARLAEGIRAMAAMLERGPATPRDLH